MKKIIHSLLCLTATVFLLQAHAQTDLPRAETLDSGWNTIPTGGLCSAGTPFQFYAKPGAEDSSHLLLFFNGGGACWFGQACDLTAQPNIHSPFADMDTNNPALSRGIFDLDNEANPFRDYHMVFVPYCTGDVHMGAGPHEYSYENSEGAEVAVTTYHNGYENSMTVLDWVYANFDDVEDIFISGSSAGAIGASFYAGLVAEHYDDTPVVLLADAAGGYNTPLLYRTFTPWDTASILPGWSEYAGATNETLTFEDFYIASARHSPNLTIAQYNAAHDATQIIFTQLIGDPPGSFDLPQRILYNYLEIEDAVDEFHSYTAGGNVHMILQSDLTYAYEIEGVRFIDWLESLVTGNPMGDISCVNEARGCANAPGDD